MNILLLTTHLEIGGIPVYVISLAKGLKEKGNRVFVASSGGELVIELNKLGIEHIKIDIRTKSEISPKVFFAAARLIGQLKSLNIDIIHAHTRVSAVLAYRLSKKLKIPFITTCHGFFNPHLGRRIFGFWGKRVIAISEAVREHLMRDFDVSEERVRLVYNGIDTVRYDKLPGAEDKEAIRKRYNIKGAPVAGIVARLSPVKGHRYLIEAATGVLKTIPEFQLLIIGDGPEKDNIKKFISELKIEASVSLNTSTLDTREPLSVMDIFILPSIQEGLGLAAIEAMACGIPVIASDVGGIGSLIKNGETGLSVPPASPKKLEEAILKLLQDESLRNKLGRQGKIFVGENFTLDKMVSGICKVYEEAVKVS